MPTIWQVNSTDFVWGDLTPDEEAARVVAKNAFGPNMPEGFRVNTSRGYYAPLLRALDPPVEVKAVPWPIRWQYGARNVNTGTETWAPPGTEGPTRPDITINTVRSLCGIVELERKVAALEAQLRIQQSRVAELESQRARVIGR